MPPGVLQVHTNVVSRCEADVAHELRGISLPASAFGLGPRGAPPPAGHADVWASMQAALLSQGGAALHQAPALATLTERQRTTLARLLRVRSIAIAHAEAADAQRAGGCDLAQVDFIESLWNRIKWNKTWRAGGD